MLGRQNVAKSAAIKAKLSAETIAIMEEAKKYNPIFGGGDKEKWNEAAVKFNAAVIAETGDTSDLCKMAIFK